MQTTVSMKTRHIFILLLALFAALSAKAQNNNIAVASFQLLPNDLTANLQGTSRIDQNGHTCALIKVVTTQTGFSFDVGIMGITDTRQEPGEIWVWVPFGVKHLTIRHPQLGVLRDYRFPCSIEEARTYEMVLISGTVKPIIDEDMGGSYLVMTVEPKTAMVYIDEQLKSIEDGVMQSFLTYGHHTYRVEAPSYMNEAGAFEIGKERVELNISLVSAKATLTVNCPDAEADIYINEQKKGRGNWTGQLAAETYIVEARKAGHRTEKQSLTLAKQEQKTVTLNAPQPIYGKLNLTSTPANCEVYLDGKMIGKSPDVFPNILIGEHSVELRKNGYETQRTKVNIEEGKIADLSLNLKRIGGEVQQPEAQQPQPQQNEKPTVQTDKWKTFIMARANTTFWDIEGPLFGCAVGRVKKTGWYLSCTTSNRVVKYEVQKFLDLTAGAMFRCKNAFYWYAGAGWGMRTFEDLTWIADFGGVELETGAMFHFKHFSIMAGFYGIITSEFDIGLQIGLGYNF